MKKKIPTFKTDKEAERFVDTADLSKYDLSGLKPVKFEFEKKSAQLNMRVPEALLEAVETFCSARNPLHAVYSRSRGVGALSS